MVIFVVLGINAWIEGIIVFFAISLNLTCQELQYTDSYGYFKVWNGRDEGDGESGDEGKVDDSVILPKG